MLKRNSILVILCIACHFSVFAEIENSVIPIIEKYENIENIPKNQLSDHQFNVISEAFSKLDQKIRIVTHNLLCDDREKQSKESDKWPNRIPRVIETFKEMQPDIICVQEQYQHQLDAWLPTFGDQYSFYGSPRGDGEVNGVVYRNDRFQLIQGSVIKIPAVNRSTSNTVTMTQLIDSKTGQLFAVFNTHLSFNSNNERSNEAEFIITQINQVAKEMPVLLAGDLNLFPSHFEQSFPFFDGDSVHRIFTRDSLRDSQEMSLLGHFGPLSTFTNAPGEKGPYKGLGTPSVMLDRIYVGPGIEVLMHAVQPGTVDGHFPSDHMPVLIDFLFTR